MKQLRTWGIAAALLALTTSGCSLGSKNNENALKPMGKDETAAIKVMYYDERAFFSEYGNLFLSKYPNIDLQVVSMMSMYADSKKDKDAMKKLIEEQQPDVLMLTAEQYQNFAADGKLFQLDPVIGQDKFNLSGLLPSMLEYIKAKGDGKIYGLAPSFYSQALFYNKDLFDKNGVPYPKDQMSWEDTLNLAKRFPTSGNDSNRVYGLYHNYNLTPYELGMSIGSTKGLSFLDVDNLKVVINTDAWKQAFQQSLDAFKSGALYLQVADPNQVITSASSYEDYLKQNLFVAGRAAMMIDGSYLIETMNQAKAMLKDTTTPNWDVVTVPVDPNNPDVSSGFSVNRIFAVNAKSPHTRAAWEFVKYIHSEEYAKIVSRSQAGIGEMISHPAYIKDKDGHHMEAFYKLKPSQQSLYQGYEKLPQDFFQPFQALADGELKAVQDGKKSLDEAIQTIQDKGQEELTKAKQAEDKAKENEKK